MNSEMLLQRLCANGLSITPTQAGQLCAYHNLLLDWNSRMDLTAVTEETEMIDRHYVDSLMPLTIPGLLNDAASVIDVGTGAGLPGIPLAICMPNTHFTLLDAQQKRLRFLQAVMDELGLENVTLTHARAEDGARLKGLRECFDAAIARALAPLPVLAEYLLPYVRIGGWALCWKGPALFEELQAGTKAARLLGGEAGKAIPLHISGRDWQHMLLPIHKLRRTPTQYPRKAGLPAKTPLGMEN